MSVADRVVAESIDYLVAHYQERPDLSFLARRAGYEVTHFQRLFSEKAGISPKRLIQYMHMRHARALLAAGGSVLEAALEAGLSGGGRLHDLMVSCAAVTPGDVRYKGRGLCVVYGFHPTRIGEVMIARTGRGICYLGFLTEEGRAEPVRRMKAHLPFADYRADDAAIADDAAAVMALWAGDDSGDGAAAGRLSLDLHGTNLQIQVWRALLAIPAGGLTTYGAIAAQVGRPAAARAVGNAVGANPVSLLIPCHRVIRSTGIIDNYGWGSARKKLLLGIEGAL